ncbi:sugar nucleotide-binding protein [Paenibacillus sp. GSMTC-2017]|uniref:SDR family oxidoreductase n=1 Tax=Paenibacillus sp. GSMTC-2017 TaxID=2794350 RepID=UPI0018D66D51|nr:sugar nucleotide-binding protein [Paenibacillus sp. GSMTC-2017]
MKFLILGAAGMAGHTIAIYLQEQGHDVTTFTRSPFPYGYNITGEISENNTIDWILLQRNYDVVINCIGLLNQACDKEPSRAAYLNSYLPHAIADRLNNTPTKLIHMSTDCVFSGHSAPYHENSFPDGETFYDRTKALGEVNDNKHLTFRNSIIGPDMKKDGIGLFNWFMQQEGSINGYTGAIWTGVTTLTLAKAMEKAATENMTGLYNLVNNSSINKYDLLKLFNKTCRADELTILPSDAVNADKTLVNTRTDFSFEVPSYEEMIIEMKEWIWAHKNLYPHYFSA